MDFAFFLDGISAPELVRTIAVAIFVCWGLHKYVISKDIQQIIDSNMEFKKELNELKTNLEAKFEREIGPLRALTSSISSLEAKFEGMKDLIHAYFSKSDNK